MNAGVLMLKGLLLDMPADMRAKVEAVANQLREVIDKNPEEAKIALPLVTAECIQKWEELP